MVNQKVKDLIDEEYKSLSLEERREIYDLFFDKDVKEELRNNLKKIIFKETPPTPEEFLDPNAGWLSKDTIESIFPNVKEEFLEIMNPEKNYFQIVNYGAVRIGKSFRACLQIVYSIIYIHCLREPQVYFNLNPASKFAQYILSFNYKKTKEIYLDVIYMLLEKSPAFKRVERQDDVFKRQKEVGLYPIIWSKASTSGKMTLNSGLQLQLGNKEFMSLIGANIIQAYISEINWYVEVSGISEDEILQIYTDVYGRISGTTGNEYLAYVYLDSSANSRETKIEKLILEKLIYQEGTYTTWKSQWEARPGHKKFTTWKKIKDDLISSGFSYQTEMELNEKLYKLGAVFKVCTGNGQIPAFIVKDEKELEGLPKDLIIYPPIDTKFEFEINLIKSIKDIAGRPSSRQNKFIPDSKNIGNMFEKHIRNIEGGIIIDSKELPEGLLWNKIHHKFFVQADGTNFRFYRASNAIRFIGLDPAFSAKGDVYGITMVHLEKDFETKNVYYVADFSFPLLPGENGINLEAVDRFIVDLKEKGNIKIGGVFKDNPTISAGTKQYLKDRNDINVVSQSTDKTIEIYQYFLTLLYSKTIKAGKNVFLKNNLEGLEYKKDDKGKEKVDHNNGSTNNVYLGDYDNSECGVNAKDVSDSLVTALFGAMKNSSGMNIFTNYREEEKRFTGSDSLELKEKKIQGFVDHFARVGKTTSNLEKMFRGK